MVQPSASCNFDIGPINGERGTTPKQNKHFNSYFLPLNIADKSIYALLDTGSAVSILNVNKWQLIPENKRPQVRATDTIFKAADGGRITTLGFTKLSLKIGNISFDHEFLIAEVDVPCILGFDFMHQHDLTLSMGLGVVQCQGETIKCLKESQLPTIYRIKATNTLELPGSSETIISGSFTNDMPHFSTGLVEDYQDRLLCDGVIVAKALIDTKSCKVPIRVINLNQKPIKIWKGMNIANCIPVCPIIDRPQEKQNVYQVNESVVESNLPEHLKPVIEECQSNLSSEEKSKVVQLLNKYQHVFSTSKSDLGNTDIVKHKINTGLAPPIKQQPRRLPQKVQNEVNEEVDRLLAAGLIEKSNGPWASPIVPVRKPDNTIRLAIDYRKLNAVTLKDSYPLPRIQDCLDCLKGAKYYSSLDLSSGFHQVQMDPDDMDKTSFVCQKGQYRFKVLSFGLTNAVATFQRLMEYIMSGLQYQTALIYVDDILVFTNDFESHLCQLDEVLSRLEKANLKVMPTKVHLFQTKLHFLGHIVDEQGILPNDEKVKAIQSWPVPKNAKQLSSFLGLVSYYRRLIKGFADIALPLHKLTHKDAKYIWTTECDLAFNNLKRVLTEAPVLGYPNSHDLYILDTDCSSYCLGSVLQQKQGDTIRVIAYYSRTLSRAERQYCVTRRELLAIVESIKHFHNYLYGVKFLIRTDHSALSWALKFQNPMGQQSRWLNTLSLYDFDVEHRPGVKHGNADALSRRPCGDCKYCEKQEIQNNTTDDETLQCIGSRVEVIGTSHPDVIIEQLKASTWKDTKTTNDLKCEVTDCQPRALESSLSVKAIMTHGSIEGSNRNSDPLRNPVCSMNDSSLLNWSLLQHEDPDIGPLKQYLSQGQRPSSDEISEKSAEFKAYWSQWPSLQLNNDIVYRQHTNKLGEQLFQILVPLSSRQTVLNYIHDHSTAGHLGEKKSYQRLKEKFYWFNCKDDLSYYCKQCLQCQSRKMPPRAPKAPLKSNVTGVPLEKVGMDIIGPLPLSNRGNKYILSIQCYFTKWVEMYPIPDIKVETIAKKFVNEFICRYGLINQIVTDQGRQFESSLFQEMCKILDITKLRSTAFHPETNGLIERMNRTMEDMLSKYISPNQKDWDEWIPVLLLAYRSSVHASTGKTPHQMMFGKQPKLPTDLLYGHGPVGNTQYSADDYVYQLQEKLRKCHNQARQSMLIAAKRQKNNYDIRVNVIPYKLNDQVWVKTFTKSKGISPKLSARWTGPFRVIKVISNLVLQIKNVKTGKVLNVHHNRLKPYP